MGTDAALAAYPSTSGRHDIGSASALLPGSGNLATYRFVLGPADLTSADIGSAAAVRSAGWWGVRLSLTPEGSVTLDDVAQHTFHTMFAVVVNDRVVDASFVEPAQPAFSSLQGVLTVGGPGGLAPQQAEAIANLF